MTCDEFADDLPEYMDGDASDAVCVQLESHAASCGECGMLLADLRRIEREAAALPDLAPSRDLWPEIAARIETPVVELGGVRAADGSHVPFARRRGLWIGLAAAGLVAVTATITQQVTARSIAARAARTSQAATTAAASQAGQVTFVANRADYDREIARLRVILDQRRPLLDSATVAVVEHNLAVIDEAIAQCTQALRRDPASSYLVESLRDALDTKVQLLRTATALSTQS